MRAESVADTRAGDAGLSGRVVIGSFWMFLGTGTQHLLQFLVLIVLARLISPTVFGMVAAALLVVGFSSIFSQLGVGPAIVQRPILTPRHVRVAFTMSLLLGLALTAFLWTTAPLIAAFFRMDGLTPVLRAVSPVFICNGLATVADSLAQRGLRFRRLAGIDVVSYAVGFALVGVGLALAGWGIWALVAAHVAQSSVRTSMLLLAQPHPKRLLLRRAEVAELMYFGGGFTLARVGNYVAGFGDNLVVGRWLGPQALGLYSHAYQLMVAPAVLFGQVLDKVLFPTMARIQLEPQRLAKAYHRGITLIALVILPLSAILYILAPELILVLLGPAWAGAAVPFQVLASGMLFRTSYKLSDSVARATGAVYRRAWRQACYALVVLLGAWLGQRWGLGGVALGVLAAITVNFLLMAQLSLRLVGMSWRTFWGAHLPALPLSIACSSTVWLLATLLRRLEWPALAIVSCSGLSALAVIGTLCACAPALFLGIEGTWLRRTAWAILPLAPGPLRRLPELAAVTSLVSHKPDFAAVTRGPGPATSLRVVRELFAAFHAAEIPYCHWKSNEHLGRSMVGLTDLDVLIDKERAGVIEQILACNGLKRFTATPLRSYPGIEDYLTLDDDDTGRLVHLHLHYQLTLGEPFLKGYRLPWEPLLLSTRRMDAEHGIYIADANLEFLLVAVRGALKLRLRNMFRKRLGSAFLAELYWLRERVEPQQVLALGEELLGGRVAGPLRALLVNEPSLRTLVSLRRAAAPSLRHHRTYGPLQARARASFREGASLLTALSRTFLGMALPARRTSPRGGLIVAILGCDGSGKSSVVEEVVGSLGRKVDILPIYFGSGDGPSSVVRLPLKLAHKLMRGTVRSRPTPPRVEGQGLERTPLSHPGNRRWRTLATVIWALALSHEKRGKLRRAVRARNRGMIVVCDRLPQNQIMGFNDGPLLARWSNHRAWLPRSLARWETTAYERCSTHPPDIVVKLTVSPEVAMARKPDTPAWEVRRRVEAVRQLRFPSTVQVVEIDAEAPLATVCLAVKRMIWRAA